jgi:hypothetical protein
MEVMFDGLVVKDRMLAMQHINGSWNPLFLFFSLMLAMQHRNLQFEGN